MEEQETIQPEYEEMKMHEIKIENDKLRIEINNNIIIFTLFKELSFYKYTKKYEYNEIKKELDFNTFKDIQEIYNHLINAEYKTINK